MSFPPNDNKQPHAMACLKSLGFSSFSRADRMACHKIYYDSISARHDGVSFFTVNTHVHASYDEAVMHATRGLTRGLCIEHCHSCYWIGGSSARTRRVRRVNSNFQKDLDLQSLDARC